MELEKANVSCHSDYRNQKAITVKCDKDLIQCKSDQDMLKELFTALNGEYVKCLTTSKLSIEFENEKINMRKHFIEHTKKMEISFELEKCEANRKECKKDLEKEKKKGWF